MDLCEHYLKGAQGEKALRYLDAALDHLEAGYLNDQAIALADRALETPYFLRGEKRLGILSKKSNFLDLLGRREAQGEVLAEARVLAGEADGKACLVRVERATGVLLYRTGRWEEAQTPFEGSLEVAREIGHWDGVTDSLIQLGEFRWRAGNEAGAHEVIQEAVDLLRQQERKGELADALALLACLPQGDVEAAETTLKEAGDRGNRPQVRYYLWKATGKSEHLAEAKLLLDHLVEHAPEAYRESMLKNVRLHREIMEAWESLDPEQGERVEGHRDG